MEQASIYYDETFSPVVKPEAVLSIAALCSWPIHQSDVKNAFLHRHLEETVYCQQPSGFVDPVAPDYVVQSEAGSPCLEPALHHVNLRQRLHHFQV